MRREYESLVFYVGVGVLAVLCGYLWYTKSDASRGRERDILLTAQIRGVYAKEEAYQRFIKDYRVRLEAVSKIAEQQKRFKEEHPDWPGTLPAIKELQNPVADSTTGRPNRMPAGG